MFYTLASVLSIMMPIFGLIHYSNVKSKSDGWLAIALAVWLLCHMSILAVFRYMF